MTPMSIGDLARNMMLQRGAGRVKSDLNRLTQELAAGRLVDPARKLAGNYSPLAAIESRLAHIDGLEAAANALSLRLGAVQSALGAMDAIGQHQSQALLRASGTNQNALIDLAARDALDHLEAVLGLLNATAGGQSVFAGMRTDRPAVTTAGPLLDAVWPLASAAATPQAAISAIQDWFRDPSGYAATIYQGADAPAAVAVGESTLLAPTTTALDPAVRDLLTGLTYAALLDRGLFADTFAGRQEIAQAAGEFLAGNAASRANLAAKVGLEEYRLAQAQTRNASERDVLAQSRTGLLAADPYATATDLEQVETQLSLIHVLTARLQGLSLLEALR